MITCITILFCVFTICSAASLEFLSNILTAKGEIPKRVRTVEEYNSRSNESVILDFIGLVERYEGYKAEEYSVTTDDGYILGLHRISGSPSHPKAEGKPAVYLQHGLFGSSDFLVLLGPEQALAFQLADAGYDVWLGNVRGTVYSRVHTNESPEHSEFWKFRMDEMGEKDISTFIDNVLERTRQKKLTYIGYSMGTTLSYILLSSKPEYNDKINLLISIAPVAYFTPPTSIFVRTIISTVLFTNTFSSEVLPQSVDSEKFAMKSCNASDVNPCKYFLSYFANDIYNLNETTIQQILAYSPAGTSYYTVEQYQQIINSNRTFHKYDYGCKYSWYCPNQRHYGQNTPPEYNMSLITVPNVIFYSAADIFVKVEDAKYLKDKLSNVVAFEEVPDDRFNHVDFIWSINARNLVYNRLLKIISENL